jgi:hypothetical protein
MKQKFKRLASSSPKGRLSRLESTVDLHSRFAENIHGEDGIRVRKNALGGITISGSGSGGTGTSNQYAGFFKLVYRTSTEGEPIIGVVDGGPYPHENHCGYASVNGSGFYVSNYLLEITQAGWYHVWLQLRVRAQDGVSHSIIVSEPSDAERPPDEFGSLGFTNRLLGRFYAGTQNEIFQILDINQVYLAGGEILEFIFGNCAGEEA